VLSCPHRFSSCPQLPWVCCQDRSMPGSPLLFIMAVFMIAYMLVLSALVVGELRTGGRQI
jgi:hypothetical protein